MAEPTIDVRRLSAAEMAEVMFPITEYAFHASPPLPHEAEFQEAIRGREGVTYLAAFEGDQAVATIAGTVMTQNVRGAIYDASGVWGVATRPEARRKGYSRRLMASLLATNHEARLPLTCLYPFRESFYERLGYVTFPLPRIARLKPAGLEPLLRQDLGGKVERQLIGDTYDLYRDYVEHLKQRTHGLGTFVHSDKTRVQTLNHRWTALAHAGGELVGLMLYELKGE
ncbi:MAG: GNAT family N-acetyltransferase, partial [Anaerolineae bacterium]|nr:GNAT family N-acetyltransferase [Anaerolineae bacterium]